ncbi:MAG: peptidoglycan DD-metalloendopeptidase family protein [Pseudomonadales bacterium]|nr:peptidoglycan DD-metalloendopeptidase family protein [Pseudomonadales bacterium]
MDDRNRKTPLPKSRKALEYRVFWLERKLSFLRESEKRELSANKISAMPSSPIKELMHLNNEFQRANDQAQALKTLTEELNKDALRINERSERMNEVTATKITDAERLNRQSRRLQDRSRNINKALLMTKAKSKETNERSESINTLSKAHIEESKYLSKLSRAQHQATDRLNQKTRSLNIEALKTAAESIQLNRQLSTSHEQSQIINSQIRALAEELVQTKLDLKKLTEESIEIKDSSIAQLKSLEAIENESRKTIVLSNKTTQIAQAQIGESDALLCRTESLNKQSEENHHCFSELRNSLSESVDHYEGKQASLCEDLTRNIAELELESISKLKGFTDYHGDIIKLKLRDAIEASNKKLDHKLEEQLSTNNSKVDEAVDRFQQRSKMSLNKAETASNLLTKRLTENLDKSQDFYDETVALNDTSSRLVNEGLNLNVTTMSLHEQCNKAITDIDGALNEFFRFKTQILDDTQQLQYQSEELNAESKLLIKTGAEMNKQSLSVQKESVNTQALSQEINSHSLALHQEIRVINQDFELINKNNSGLVERLNILKEKLQELFDENQHQVDDASRTNAQGQVLNQESNKLNAESQVLNGQMLATLKSAKTALAESENLNNASQTLSREVRSSVVKLEIAREEVEQASVDSRLVTAEVRQVVNDTLIVRSELTASAGEVKALCEKTNEELSSLVSLKKESVEIVDKSRDAYMKLKNCITKSEQINDDFMRGLEATGKAHRETEQTAIELLDESKILQADIRDMLSLRTGVQEFQTNIDNCQNRLDQYTEELDYCKQSTSSHSEILRDYQSRIENYHTELKRYKDSVIQYETRARKLETFFGDQDSRIRDIENHQDNIQNDLLGKQVEQMRELEMEIRTALKSNKTTLFEEHSILKSSMKSALERLGDEIKNQLLQEIDNKEKQQNGVIEHQGEMISSLNMEFDLLNQNVAKEIKTLREESLEMRNQNREFMHEQRNNDRAQSNRIDHYKQDIDDVNHKLGNYQELLESRLDDQDTTEMSSRLNRLEHNIRSQQSINSSRESDKDSIDSLSNKVMGISVTLEDVVASNRNLKTQISDSEKRNRQLIKHNNQLKASIQDRDHTLQNYSERLQAVEKHEHKYLETISLLKSNEIDTKQTLQQMRLAMKDSTKAMRETQVTLQGFKNDHVKPNKSKWMENSKQAVLSSFFAIVMTSMAFMGFENVDASVAERSAVQPMSAQQTVAQQIRPLQIPSAKRLNTLFPRDKQIASRSDFSWPVNFAMLDANSIDYKPHHQGINISAELGAPVLAINDGVVIYSAKEIRGYGNVIVIQHENELVSVYANNQFNYVIKGDTVRRGQLIGDVGQLLNEEKSGLYFEIRYMGTPEDPFNYLNRTSQAEYLSMR